jgi:peptidoglycan/LPS O-acetylase OafA/YrhL
MWISPNAVIGYCYFEADGWQCSNLVEPSTVILSAKRGPFSMRHSANLDLLRTIAVSAVLVDHLMSTLHIHAGYTNMDVLDFFASIGQAGVLAFFVHTALVLMYSLERLHAVYPRVTWRFYVRRIFRIYPLAIFTVLLAFAFHVPSFTWKDSPQITTGILAANLLLVQNLITKVSIIAPLWSLPYEVQMYVVLPALYLLARRKRGLLYIAALLGSSYIFGLLLFSLGHLGMAAFIPYFLCGVLVYTLRNRQKKVIPAFLWIPFLLVLIAIFCWVNTYQSDSPIMVTPTFWSAWIFGLILALSLNAFKESKARPVNVVADKVALYSYGMYLLHLPVLYLVFMKLEIPNVALAIVLYFLLTGVGSIATFHLIESPFIKIGKKLTSGGRFRGTRDLEPVLPAP